MTGELNQMQNDDYVILKVRKSLLDELKKEIKMVNYHIVKDLTQDVRQVSNNINGFPKDVKIVKAGLAVDDWGTYYIDIDYELDGVKFNITRIVYGNLSGAVNEALGAIKDFYVRTHTVKA